MSICPFCKGQALRPHTPQDCLSHMRVRLREMTERRDALQVSLDNQRRVNEALRQRCQKRIATITARYDWLSRQYSELRQAGRRSIKTLRTIKRACDEALEIGVTK